MPITVMSYNIERGFHTPDHVLEEHRLAAAQRAVEKVDPDVLALTEACYGGNNSHRITMDYRRIFGFPHGKFGGYPVFGPRKGDEGGNCLLSRLPMQARRISLPHKSAVRGKISVGDGALMIDVVHPSYSVSDDEKINTLRTLIAARQEPYLLTGDFNTVHPDDRYDWGKLEEELLASNPEKTQLLLDNWRGAGLVSYLLGLGLQDAIPPDARRSTVPTRHAYQEDMSGVRMDFFFVSPDVHVLDAYVLKDDDTETASDHYPIVGVFDIK